MTGKTGAIRKRRLSTKQSKQTKKHCCDICRKDVNDPIELGEIMEAANIKVHYYCLLTSYYAVQLGQDTGGILGFLVADIRTAIKHAQNKICIYCNEISAHSKCHLCDDHYHLVCGLKENCLFEFKGEFKTFCNKHVNIVYKEPHKSKTACYVCFQEMGEYNPVTSITSGCCTIKTWVHRRCMKRYALSAGYYLKCLWCKDPIFREDVRLLGIFVPDRDATWELDKGVFSDLYKRHSQCDIANCLCPTGRSADKSSRWNVIVCRTCAAWGVHVGCMPVDTSQKDEVQCPSCVEIFNRTLGLSQSQIKLPRQKETEKRKGQGKSNISSFQSYVKIRLEDRTSFEVVFEKDGIVQRVQRPVKSNEKIQFDDELIHQLVREELNPATVCVIEVDSDSNSVRSATHSELFEKMMEPTPQMPKPLVVRRQTKPIVSSSRRVDISNPACETEATTESATKKKSRSRNRRNRQKTTDLANGIAETDRNIMLPSQESCSLHYPTSPLASSLRLEANDSNQSMTVHEKVQKYFDNGSNFRSE